MWFNVFLLTACLFLINCGGDQSTPSGTEEEKNVAPKGSMLYISLSDQKILSLDDIFEEYCFMPLETQNSILLKGISSWRKIMKRDSLFYISDLNRIYVFDSQGCFERLIDHQGEGPYSYRGLVAFTLDSNGDVFVLDRGTMRLYVYSRKDEFK